MAHHDTRPVPARRLFTYRAPRVGSFDCDYGGYYEHTEDPRYSGPMLCQDCGGSKHGPDGEKCPHCNGTGTYWETDE